MSKIVIEARNLAKRYRLGENIVNRYQSKEFWALKDVSFDIKEGEAIGILGSNGAGKSTLLKILSRITMPTEGHARIRGKVRTLLEIGTGFQGELTGRENIYLNGTLLGMSYKEVRRKFDEIIAFSEIEDFLDTPVKRYSSGMYVRLAFAVAAHLEPDILIVDEVLAVGDINFQKKCLQKLDKETTEKGKTILFVSHNLTTIRSFCTRSFFLKNGQLFADDVTDVVVKKYLESMNQAVMLDEKNIVDRLNRATGKVRFTSIDAFDSIGRSRWAFRTGETISIELKYSVHHALPSLTLLLYIRSVDQKIISTLKKVLSLHPLEAGYQGHANIKIQNVPLREGEYGLYICFGDLESGYNHDIVDEAIVPYLFISSDEQDQDLRKGYVSMEYEISSSQNNKEKCI